MGIVKTRNVRVRLKNSSMKWRRMRVLNQLTLFSPCPTWTLSIYVNTKISMVLIGSSPRKQIPLKADGKFLMPPFSECMQAKLCTVSPELMGTYCPQIPIEQHEAGLYQS